MRLLMIFSIAIPIAITFGFSGNTDKPGKEPSYRILKTERDPSLGEHYAVYELRFQFEADTYVRLPDGQWLEYMVDNVYHRTVLDDSMKTEVYVRPGNHTFFASYKGFKAISTKRIPIKSGYRTIIVFEFKPVALEMEQPEPKIEPEKAVK